MEQIQQIIERKMVVSVQPVLEIVGVDPNVRVSQTHLLSHHFPQFFLVYSFLRILNRVAEGLKTVSQNQPQVLLILR